MSSSLASDVRHALRSLRRAPAYTAIAVGVLAIGVGASTGTFAVVDHILFEPLALPDSERLVTLCETHLKMREWCGLSPVNATDWAASSRTLDALGVARGASVSLRADDGHARGVAGGIATPGFFHALGLVPQAGRLLSADDQPPSGDGHAVLISAAFWQRALGGDPAAVGRTLRLDDQTYRVVGVLPEGARVPRLDWVEVWMPLPFDPRDEANRDWRGFVSAGRLAPGATLAAAQAELAALRGELERAHPEALRGWGVRVQRMRDYLTADVRPLLLVFLAAVGLLLLVVCTSLSNLLLARLSTRQLELAVRTALGASRAALARQLLAESALVSLLGGGLGFLVATACVRLFVALAPPGVPRLEEVTVDARAFAFCLAASLLVQLLVAAAASLQQRRALATVTRQRAEQGATRSGVRLRRALVAAEVALAVVLLAAAGLLLRSFGNLLAWDPGFDTERLLLFQTFLSQEKYAEPEQLRALYRRLEGALTALPGVRAVATGSSGPVFGGGDGATAILAGGAATSEHAPTAPWFDVGPTYFSTLGLPVVEGRAFAERDDASATKVLLVNQTLARRLRADGKVVGARLRLPELAADVRSSDGEAFAGEIVGVVADVPAFEAGHPPEPALYIPNRQRPRWGTFFLLRTTGDPRALAELVTRSLAQVDPGIAPSHLSTLTDEVALRLERPRFSLGVVAAFAAVSLLLGMAGVYGVVGYTVSLRRHELGIRMALGAAPAAVLRQVLASGLRMVAIGGVSGVAAALLLTRLLRDLLYGVLPADPLAFGGTAVVIAASALAACLAPALRASRVDPNLALRAE